MLHIGSMSATSTRLKQNEAALGPRLKAQLLKPLVSRDYPLHYVHAESKILVKSRHFRVTCGIVAAQKKSQARDPRNIEINTVFEGALIEDIRAWPRNSASSSAHCVRNFWCWCRDSARTSSMRAPSEKAIFLPLECTVGAS